MIIRLHSPLKVARMQAFARHEQTPYKLASLEHWGELCRDNHQYYFYGSKLYFARFRLVSFKRFKTQKIHQKIHQKTQPKQVSPQSL